MRSNGKAWHGWSASVHRCFVHSLVHRHSSSESSRASRVESTPTHSDRLILSVGGLVKWREAQRSGRHKEPPPWTNYKVGIPMYLRLMKVAHTGLRSREIYHCSHFHGESQVKISPIPTRWRRPQATTQRRNDSQVSVGWFLQGPDFPIHQSSNHSHTLPRRWG